MTPAANSGTSGKSRWMPIAAPMNSARSVAMAMTSAWIHSPTTAGYGKLLPADLGQVEAGRDAELGAHRLDEHRHEVGGEDDPQEHVAVLRAARDVGGEVARVDIGDGGDKRRAEEGQQRPQAARLAAERLLRGAKDALLTRERNGYGVRGRLEGRQEWRRRRGRFWRWGLNGQVAALLRRTCPGPAPEGC